MYHLRRIGLPASVEGVQNEFRINSDATLVGRGSSVDIFLDSNIRKGLISRAHAQIIRKTVNDEDIYEIFDTSLNGTYVNDFRIKGSQILKEGDVVAFGHLRGFVIKQGERAPQRETEFLFKFEKFIKDEVVDLTEKSLLHPPHTKSSVFMSPRSPNAPDAIMLPGLTSTFPAASDLEEISRKRKWTCSETSVHQNHTSDIKELISNVTQKINANTDEENHEDSFNLDFDCDVAPAKKVPPTDVVLSSTKPVHPRDKHLSNTLSYANSPCSFASSDSDIKHDTSLNVKHVEISDDSTENEEENDEENDEEQQEEICIIEEKSTKVNVNKTNNTTKKNKSKKKTVTSKLREVLQTLNKNKKPRRQIEEETESDSIDSESTLSSEELLETCSDSEKSEEITDHSSDNEFLPNAEPVYGRTRTRHIKSPKKLHVVSTRKQTYTHDECAAWDCKRPSGAIKKITWVQCDDCDAWYHLICSGLKTKDATREDTYFHCGC